MPVPLVPMVSFTHFCILFYCIRNDFTEFVFSTWQALSQVANNAPVPAQILAIKLLGQTVFTACQ